MQKIFIVEDDRGIAEAVASQAERWAFDVRIASDFRDVAGEVAQFQPHIVLMDIGLPFFSGYYCAAKSARPRACRSSSCPRRRTT